MSIQLFETWKKKQNQFLFGCAGTGKTFVSLYLAYKMLMNYKQNMTKLYWCVLLYPQGR